MLPDNADLMSASVGVPGDGDGVGEGEGDDAGRAADAPDAGATAVCGTAGKPKMLLLLCACRPVLARQAIKRGVDLSAISNRGLTIKFSLSCSSFLHD